MTDEEFKLKVSTDLANIASCLCVLADAEYKRTSRKSLKLPDTFVMLLIGGCIYATFSKAGDVFVICALTILVYSLLKAGIVWIYRKHFTEEQECP